ncbi:MAG: transglycosylase domain-containing protein [candidate division NC10 bacterium]|nr:transglycosylase domain-containing protein [candidate division NC10 bacterium]
MHATHESRTARCRGAKGAAILILLGAAWYAIAWILPLPAEGLPPAGPTIRLMAGRHEIALLPGAGARYQVWVPPERIPPVVVAAVLAAEDRRFHAHIGIDTPAVLRAAVANVRHGEIRQGGSTVTQQLARGLFLGPERRWVRKLQEIALALLLEARYSKARLLATYLNTVYMGHRQGVAIHGLGAAARHDLGKSLEAVRPEEAALLAAGIRAPNAILAGDPERARRARDRVLRAMRDTGALDAPGLAAALRRPTKVTRRGAGPVAGYFRDLAREEIRGRATLPPSGEVTIATSLDPALQRSAERAVRAGIARLEAMNPAAFRGTIQAALVAIEPATGEIRALVGGIDYGRSPFNRATRARRQPGSVFKPFIYLAAFEAEREGAGPVFTPASLVPDEPIAIQAGGGLWTPRNLDRRFHGPVTIRRALEDSLNVPAVRVARTIGLERVARMARAAGITSPQETVPAMALGTSSVTLLEITAAFGTLANQGLQVTPTTLAAVQDPETRPLIARPPPTVRAASRQSAYLITHLLRGIMREGTGRGSRAWGLADVTAGKTGTTDDLRDAWFVGYVPDLVVGVWVGRDDNRPLGLTGAQAALPIWGAVMAGALRARPARPFVPPPGVAFAPVERATGAFACGGGEVVEEAFLAGTEPKEAACGQRRSDLIVLRPFFNWLQNLLR